MSELQELSLKVACQFIGWKVRPDGSLYPPFDVGSYWSREVVLPYAETWAYAQLVVREVLERGFRVAMFMEIQPGGHTVHTAMVLGNAGQWIGRGADMPEALANAVLQIGEQPPGPIPSPP